MAEPRSIVSYQVEQVQDYGRVKVKLAQLLQSRGMTRNRLSIRRSRSKWQTSIFSPKCAMCLTVK